MIGILRRLIQQCYRLTPKFNYAVVWGWPDYEDSVIALEQGLQKSRVRKIVLLMTCPDSSPFWEPGQKTIRIRKNSPAGFLWFCFARYVFFTHPCFTREFPKSVVAVNVWHGMPIKKIGRLIANDPVIAAPYVLATSPFWGEIMERSIAIEGTAISVGLPRNDRLFSSREKVMEKLGLSCNMRLLAWLPTYRKSVCGLPRTDGTEAGNVFEMPDIDTDKFNKFLKSKNTILVVKPHPMAAFFGGKTWSNLLIVDDAWLKERRLSLYEFLGATDLLISDISSVVIDYLLLDRPIIHAFADLKEYENSRGFTVEPIADYLVGPVVTCEQELCTELDQLLAGNDAFARKRREIRTLSHSHLDAGSSQRLLKTIGL